MNGDDVEGARRVLWAYVDSGEVPDAARLAWARDVLTRDGSVGAVQLLERADEVAASGLGDHGYICKRCHGPSPVGVGYVGDATPDAARASAGITRCACGYSVHPDHLGDGGRP